MNMRRKQFPPDYSSFNIWKFVVLQVVKNTNAHGEEQNSLIENV